MLKAEVTDWGGLDYEQHWVNDFCLDLRWRHIKAREVRKRRFLVYFPPRVFRKSYLSTYYFLILLPGRT